MTHRLSDADLKTRFSFEVALRFEIFYALQTLADPQARIHPRWRSAALARLPADFHQGWEGLGRWSPLWAMVGDLLKAEEIGLSFDELVLRLERIPDVEWQRGIFKGALHSEELADALSAGRISVQAAIASLPAAKREWLEFIGLYPYEERSPAGVALECLQRSPDAFRAQILNLLRVFWREVFEATWTELVPQFRRSMEEKERLFHSCSLREFARLSLLRVEVDEREQYLGAVRGGYRLPFEHLRRSTLLPSAFNDKRYWSAYERTPEQVDVIFPYFDPSLSIDREGAFRSEAEPELDAALIFKALGDGTRFALAALLAKAPHTPAELASALAVSRPTISHHLHLMREAGLVDEERSGNSISLRLRREAIAQLSDLTLRRLYPLVRSAL